VTHSLSLRDLLAVVVITDPAALGGPAGAARKALAAGATAIQVRWKDADTRDVLALVRDLRGPTREAGALLIVNDRLDIALAAAADGVHLGDDDLPVSAVRAVAPVDFIVGRSVDSAEEAAVAEKSGADYVGFGPIHPTGSKVNTGQVVGEESIAAVRSRVSIPIVAIGGIDRLNAAGSISAGADGVAVISEVMNARDPEKVTAELVAEVMRAKVGRRGIGQRSRPGG
jgi:thiamine-phosphate pyrophosphorylase